MPQTLYDKIWKEHIVHQQDDGTTLLYVDRHLIHEVTSPQAFEGLRISKRKVRKPNLTLAVADHNVPTTSRAEGGSAAQPDPQCYIVEAMEQPFEYTPSKSSLLLLKLLEHTKVKGWVISSLMI